MSDTKYVPTERKYGHGCITLTHYPSSQRIAVVQIGTKAVMDSWEFLEFAKESGLLAAHDREVAEKAWDEGHKTRWWRDPDDGCTCGAWARNECGCGNYGTGELLSLNDNPYRGTPEQEGKIGG